MKSLLIAWKDFNIRIHDLRGFMMMILMPLVLTAILGSALSGTMGNESLPNTVLAYYQADEDAAAVMLKHDVLAGSSFKDVVQIKEVSSKEEAMRLVKSGKADVGLIIPPGWSANLKEVGILKEPILLTDPSKAVRASMIENIILVFSNELKTTTISTGTVVMDLAQSTLVSTMKIDMNSFSNHILQEVQQDSSSTIEEGTVGNKTVSSKQYYAAGMGVMFLLFNATVGAKMIVHERSTETLARLLSTPTSALSILFGKFFGTLLFAFVQFLIFVGATHYGFGVSWGDDIGQLLTVGIAYSICVSGLSMVIAATIQNEKTADIIGGVGIQLLSLLGGSMLPIYAFPETLRNIANLAPNKWALTSFLDIMGGTTWISLLPAVLVLVAIGFISVTIGTIRLRVR